LPRFVFLRIPEEGKPLYVDFASPISIEIFAKFVRRASAMSVSEMLPAHDETWLPDARGNRYTSELRLTAVDALTWIAP
jgi:hypothetical protein